jgi:replicative superfamily II helicase
MRTSSYRYIKYPFKTFNPVQAQVLEHAEEDTNLVVAAPTASGKTICGELIGGHTLENGLGTVIYLSPLKALTEEKRDTWTSSKHTWNEYEICVLTGDYQLTKQKEKELNDAAIILTTYEMMAVRCRRAASEKSDWIHNAGTLLVDESHFLSSEDRGSHLECALVNFSQYNPESRIVFLSATMVNVEELAEWLTTLNGKDTTTIVSDYRPCKLNVHFEAFTKAPGNVFGTYRENEARKYERLISTVSEHTDDQWLIFVHSKRAGRDLLRLFEKRYEGVTAFHNADLSRTQRAQIESYFKSGKIRYLIATSTLAYGMNLPARRVAICGVNRGINEVEPMDIIQEFGRAGRPSYDDEGDAYLILGNDEVPYWEKVINDGIQVKSKLTQSIGFHLIGEISEQRVDSLEAADTWFKKTLAFQQGLESLGRFESTIDVYKKEKLIRGATNGSLDWGNSGIVEDTDETYDEFEATTLGQIASMHYFDPLDVVAWKKNLWLLGHKNLRNNDAAFVWAWVSTHTNKGGFIPSEMKEFAEDLMRQTRSLGLFVSGQQGVANGTILYHHLQGNEHVTKMFPAFVASIINDYMRVITCLKHIDARILRNRSSQYWNKMRLRISYGIPVEQYELCTLPGVGKKYSAELLEAGIRSIEDIKRRKGRTRAVLPAAVWRGVKDHLDV